MEELHKLLEECLNRNLFGVTISSPRIAALSRKITVKPFVEKGILLFQFTEYREKQVFHSNLEQNQAKMHIIELMAKQYKQMDIRMTDCRYSVLVSKKGKVSVKRRNEGVKQEIKLSHNRKKEYLLPDDEPVPFLVKLGVQAENGKIIDKKYKKFRQINRFLEFVRDVLPFLPKDRTITIIDFGCGKSYLTFAMYYYLKIRNGYDVQMIGLDLKADVIQNCSRLADELGYTNLTFLQGDISSYEGVNQVDMVVTLHACDTATDYALDKAVSWNAKVILSVPCCQHEMNQKIQSELLQPVLKYGILKERMAALLTDGIRASLLEEKGYEVQILEFIDMEHTPKNLLIRAVHTHKESGRKEDYRIMCDALNTHGTLESLLDGKGDYNVK